MALVLNEEQQMLRDSARDFLAGRAPLSHLRELRDSGNEDGFSRELWAEMSEMGWPAILVPEAHGGLGYGHAGLGIVLEETGRTLTPSPLLGTALVGATALVRGGTERQQADILPGVAAGETLLALACDEQAQHEPGRVATEAVDSGDGWRLNGRKVAVLDGQSADHFVVSAWTGGGVSLFLVDAALDGVGIEPYPVLDTHRAADVRFDHVDLPASALLGEADGGQALLDEILDVARIGVSAELLGLGLEVFERTLEYLRDRKQFGVPIGSFQALQHRAAKLYAELEMCKSLVIKALQSLDSGAPDQAEMASLAKAKLSATAVDAALEGIQMHGGIGMTDDFDIGFFLKRARVLESLYGDRYYHLDRYARVRGY